MKFLTPGKLQLSSNEGCKSNGKLSPLQDVSIKIPYGTAKYIDEISGKQAALIILGYGSQVAAGVDFLCVEVVLKG